MAISNSEKRRLSCCFCSKRKEGCKCQKYWKDIYRENREEILKMYHSDKRSPRQQKTNLSEF